MKKAVIGGFGCLSILTCGYAFYLKSQKNDQQKSSFNQYKQRDDMKLMLVQVVFRHGARTALLTPEYLPPVEYSDQLLKHEEHTLVPYYIKVLDGNSTEVKKSVYNHPDKIHGELTAKGANQMHQLGCQLKKLYIEDSKLIPPFFSDAITVRSTSVKRAVESARCTLSGLFPDQKTPIPIEVASSKSEIMYPNFNKCKYLHHLTKWSWLYPDLIDGLKKEREDIQSALNIPKEKNVHLVDLRDYLFAHNYHNVLPEYLNKPDILRKTEMAAVKIMDHVFAGYHHTRDVALQLGIGPLLTLFMDNIQSCIEGSSNVKMRLFSGHDTTLMPLLRTLSYEDFSWTPYGANIAFELYAGKNQQNNTDHFVRVLYQHKGILIPGCDDEYCQVDQFHKALSKFFIREQEHESRCSVIDDDLLKSVPKVEQHSKP